jgi:hypothetical protein
MDNDKINANALWVVVVVTVVIAIISATANYLKSTYGIDLHI